MLVAIGLRRVPATTAEAGGEDCGVWKSTWHHRGGE
jgi:hypothetical protein